jgi:hypothetical protein
MLKTTRFTTQIIMNTPDIPLGRKWLLKNVKYKKSKRKRIKGNVFFLFKQCLMFILCN